MKRDKWPKEARKIMENAGIQKEAGAVIYGDARQLVTRAERAVR